MEGEPASSSHIFNKYEHENKWVFVYMPEKKIIENCVPEAIRYASPESIISEPPQNNIYILRVFGRGRKQTISVLTKLTHFNFSSLSNIR